MNNNTTLNSIIESRLIFLSAQPDDIYFHWQVELYLYQFSKHGILDNCYALFGYVEQNPSSQLIELSKKYPKNIIWYIITIFIYYLSRFNYKRI